MESGIRLTQRKSGHISPAIIRRRQAVCWLGSINSFAHLRVSREPAKEWKCSRRICASFPLEAIWSFTGLCQMEWRSPASSTVLATLQPNYSANNALRQRTEFYHASRPFDCRRSFELDPSIDTGNPHWTSRRFASGSIHSVTAMIGPRSMRKSLRLSSGE